MASRERDVETVILNLLDGVTDLDAFEKQHHDSVAVVEADQITVKATRQARILYGPQGFEYNLEVSIGQGILRTGSVDDFNDAIHAIDDELAEPTSNGGSSSLFDYFEIKEDQDSSKDARPKEIRRVARYVIHAGGQGITFDHSMDFSTLENSFYIPLI